MSSDGAIFVRRALLLLDRLQAGTRTSARWLAEAEEISEPTARRVVERLRWEYGAPIRWDHRACSYSLADPDWSFPPAKLTSTAERIALFCAVGTAGAVAAPELRGALDLLRARLGQTLGLGGRRLARLARAYSSDRTDLAIFGDPVVQHALDAISRGRRLRFTYGSPWSGEASRRRDVLPLHVRQVDGGVYLLALDGDREVVFNLSFAGDPELGDADDGPASNDQLDAWCSSFGVWYGEGQIEVCVTIHPPASRYYASQRWHRAQRDTSLDSGALIRRFPAHPSPELRRRLLSLGAALAWVEPASLREAVREDALALAGQLAGDEESPT